VNIGGETRDGRAVVWSKGDLLGITGDERKVTRKIIYPQIMRIKTKGD